MTAQSAAALRTISPSDDGTSTDIEDVSEATPSASPTIGRVVAVSGAQAVVALKNEGPGSDARPQIGTLMTISTGESEVIGTASGLSIPSPEQFTDAAEAREFRLVELELGGEIVESPDGAGRVFRRGISSYPSLGDLVSVASRSDLQIVFAPRDRAAVKVGRLHQDTQTDAHLLTNELLAKHFAVLGATGSGKSCVVALILRRILEQHQHAHMVILDPHNEYGAAFGDMVEVIGPDTLQIPFWMLNFEEILDVVFPDADDRRGVEVELLRELIPAAKQRYSAIVSDRSKLVRRAESASVTPAPSVDTPVPYKISDVTALIEERLGGLDRAFDLAPYKRLRARLQTLATDARYAFMFGGLTVNDVMQDVIERIFRIPTAGKPLTVLDLSTAPAEVVNAVVSVVSRIAFELASWSERSIPITIVCEEAHRYIPREKEGAELAATRSISRIAREGRKYGVGLCIVSQRPAEIAPTILSQSSTVIAMRMTNRHDQDIVRSAVTDASANLIEFLPALSNGEAVILGEGVRGPMRVRFDRLPQTDVPRSQNALFSQLWSEGQHETVDLGAVIQRWRLGYG